MPREQLPRRRAAETLTFELQEGSAALCYVGTLGYYENGQPGEIFLNALKQNTPVDANARDAAIAASLALQFGCPIETLRHALTRNPDGSPATPLGKFLDLVSES